MPEHTRADEVRALAEPTAWVLPAAVHRALREYAALLDRQEDRAESAIRFGVGDWTDRQEAPRSFPETIPEIIERRLEARCAPLVEAAESIQATSTDAGAVWVAREGLRRFREGQSDG